jgi:L-lysine 2,3-aminomutase
VHKTRVEIDLERFADDLSYLQRNREVTDVVLTAAGDVVGRMTLVETLAARIGTIPHVNALRLRSTAFAHSPERFTRAVIDRLARINRVTVVRPLRLEIEARFLHATQVLPAHRELTAKLRSKGITVYCNTPLLGEVNDSPEEISKLAYRLREAGVEFHHVYVAGLPFQVKWNRRFPVDVATVIDIGSVVRKDGSGREIPRYIIATALGEVDFGLTSKLYRENGRFSARLSPYNLEYYRQMEPDFQWPEGVGTDPDGAPVAPVEGLSDSGNFLVFER